MVRKAGWVVGLMMIAGSVAAFPQSDEPKPVIVGHAFGRYEVAERLATSDFSDPSEWVVQTEEKPSEHHPEIRFSRGAMDVWMPDRGVTIWYENHLQGPIAIVYRVTAPSTRLLDDFETIMPRDINVFWNAFDPGPDGTQHLPPFDSTRFTGAFPSYNKQHGYYASTGGGYNRTTRFRRYPRSVDGQPAAHIALNERDGDAEYMITPDVTYTVQVVAARDIVQYIVDGRVVYEMQYGDEVAVEQPGRSSGQTIYTATNYPPYPGGWFGFRLLKSHHRFTHFSVYRLEPVDA